MPFHRLLSAALLGASLSVPALAGDTLSWHGYGDLRIGMSRRAFHAAGHALSPAVAGATNDPADPRFDWRGCIELPLRGRPQFHAMFEDGLLVRLVVADRAVATRARVSVGADEARVRHAYATGAAASAQKYSDVRRNLAVPSRDGRHGFVFVIEDGAVIEIRAGFADAVQYDDGCPC
jgi:hypothetical protein